MAKDSVNVNGAPEKRHSMPVLTRPDLD